MKRLIFAVLMTAVFCAGASAKDAENEKAKDEKKPEASLKAAGEGFCKAGFSGDIKYIFNFMYHPAMQKKAAEVAGLKDEKEFFDNFKGMFEQMMKEDPLKACKVTEAYAMDCPSYAKVHFEQFGLKVEKCGKLEITLKSTKDDKEHTLPLTAGQVGGKWYSVLEDIETGQDYSDTGENDMGLRDFAKSYCTSMELWNKGEIATYGISGIPVTEKSDNQTSMTWDTYIKKVDDMLKVNVEPVSCSVMSTENFGECPPDTSEAYAKAGKDIVTCGIIDLSVFMNKLPWYNGLSAVFVDGSWHIDTSSLVELSNVSE